MDDLTYNADDYNGFKQTKNQPIENGLNMDPETEFKKQYSTNIKPSFRPVEAFPTVDNVPQSVNYQPSIKQHQLPVTNQLPPSEDYYSPMSSIYQPPTTNFYPTSITNYEPPIGTKTATQHSSPDSQNKIVLPLPNKSEYGLRLVGTLALIKLGLVKLKAFGIINILIFILFILKLFLIAIFFKSLLLMKLIVFFKIAMSPLFFFPIFATLLSPMVLAALFSVPTRVQQTLFPSSYYSTPISTTTTRSVLEVITSRPTRLPSVSNNIGSLEILQPSSQTTLIPGRPSTSATTTFIPGQTEILPFINPDLFPVEENIPSYKINTFKNNDMNVPHKQNNKELKNNDSVLDNFKKLLE